MNDSFLVKLALKLYLPFYHSSSNDWILLRDSIPSHMSVGYCDLTFTLKQSVSLLITITFCPELPYLPSLEIKVKKDVDAELVHLTTMGILEELRSGHFSIASREGALLPPKTQTFVFYTPSKVFRKCQLARNKTAKLTAETVAKEFKHRVQVIPSGATFSSLGFSTPSSGPPEVLVKSSKGAWDCIEVADGVYELPSAKKAKSQKARKPKSQRARKRKEVSSDESYSGSSSTGGDDEGEDGSAQDSQAATAGKIPAKALVATGSGVFVLFTYVFLF